MMMRFIFIFTLSLGLNLYAADRGKVLIIGDDQTQGAFGQNLFSGLDKKYEVHSYSVCGTRPKSWVGGQTVENLRGDCRVPQSKDPFNQRHSDDSSSLALSAEQLTGSKADGMFEAALKHHKPDMVIIQLGDSLARGYVGEIDEGIVASEVDEIIQKLEALAPDLPECRWIGPTFGENKSSQVPGWSKEDDQVKKLNEAIAKGLEQSGAKCQLIAGDTDELKVALGDDFTVDGLHLNDEANAKWASTVLAQLPSKVGIDATGADPCPVQPSVEDVSPEAARLLSQTNDVLGSLDDDSSYVPPDTASVRRSAETDQMFSSAYRYSKPETKSGLLPKSSQSSGGGFFSGLGSFLSGIFEGIGKFFSAIFSGITGLFNPSNSAVPLNGLSENPPVSTDPLDRNSNLLGYTQDDSGRMPASIQAFDNGGTIDGSDGPALTSYTIDDENPGVDLPKYAPDGRRRRTVTGTRPDTTYIATTAPVNDRALDEDEETLLNEGKRLGAGSWMRLSRLSESAYDRGGTNFCQNKLKNAYADSPGGAIWGELSLEQRADRIKKHSEISLRRIKETSDSTADSSKRSSPHHLSRLLDSSIASCISFIETRGTLNPQSMNYTMCQERGKSWSTASGLGQMTRTTFRSLYKQGNLPITTTSDYEGKNSDQIFYSITDDVALQMEVLFRLMNDNLKRAERSGGSDEAILLRAVAAYDQDNQSKYVKMFKSCHRCMNNLQGNQDPMHCYREMGK